MNRDIDMLKKLRNQIGDEPSGLQMAPKPAEPVWGKGVSVMQV
jgi:hypothetical protein